VARGFESKAVSDQQEEAQRGKPAPGPAGDAAALRARRTLELARVDVQRRLAAAPAGALRETLQRALDELERQLAALPGSPGH
jgi:hypothetical protein